MEGQRVGGQAGGGRARAGRQAIGTGLHQQAIGVETIFLRERGKRRESIRLFHISVIIEIFSGPQVLFQ